MFVDFANSLPDVPKESREEVVVDEGEPMAASGADGSGEALQNGGSVEGQGEDEQAEVVAPAADNSSSDNQPAPEEDVPPPPAPEDASPPPPPEDAQPQGADEIADSGDGEAPAEQEPEPEQAQEEEAQPASE